MITFFTHCRPFKDEFRQLQWNCMSSWQQAVPGAEVMFYGPDGNMTVRDLFQAGERDASHDWLCEISSDIALSADFLPALEQIQSIERPFVIGQRLDRSESGATALHPPTAADYFIYRKGTLGEIPPFHIGRTAYDNWLIWAAMNWGLTVIDATAAITAVHQNHSYPEYDSRAKMLASKEKEENYRLARDTGMPRWYNVNETPYILNGAGVQKRNA